MGAQPRLVVFADEWGGHPSSCQHLVRHLLDRYSTVWVDTIGMRPPALTAGDLRKVGRHIAHTLGSLRSPCSPAPSLRVLVPVMWPGFRTRWQRRLNARLVSRVVNRALGPRTGERRIALTTLPITADLIGRIDVDEWVYYRVDDFSTWPGLDRSVMRQMEAAQVQRVDRMIAASAPLRQHLVRCGRQAAVLTHGVDVEHWSSSAGMPAPDWFARLEKPIWLFWGLVDRRLDHDWCRALAEGGAGPGTLVMVGPRPLRDLPSRRIVTPGPVSYAALPSLAAAADVLVMPYADLSVTRLGQPLKLKEYLATSKAVVARSLPATLEWAKAADIVETLEDFLATVRRRAHSGATAAQLQARSRLRGESWANKAVAFERLLLG